VALRSLRGLLMAFGTLIFLVTPSAIYSCGPFLESAIFSFEDRPDEPAENFAASKLGIIRPGFRQAYLVVAYRYLAGLKLTDEQQKAALDIWNRNLVPENAAGDDAIARWSEARNKIPSLPPAPAISPYAVVSKDQPYFQYLNCPNDAFQSAIKTLEVRAAQFGLASADLREWASGQDQVFANCGGEAHAIPVSLNSDNALLRADRTYQIAAAHFYARDFDEAVAQFDAIAKDRSSPWSGISSYLAARALVRKANLVHKETAQFDHAALSEAQRRLETIVADPQAGSVHEAAVKLLDLVRFRTEPEKRVVELDRVILQADLGTNFKQNFWDYLLLLSHGEQGEDPSDWLQTFHGMRSNYAAASRELAAKHAVAQWQETKSLPWLIAALAGSDSHTPSLQSLLGAAIEVPGSSPGYLTVRYYALRLMTATGQSDAARRELDNLLKSSDLPLASRNLLNEERLKITTSLEDFLQHAPEAPVPSEVDMNTGEEIPRSSYEDYPSDPLFNRYAAEVLVKRLPLSVLLQAAESSALPEHLRREVARSAWARSILVDDLDSASELQGVLQEVDVPLWKTMEPFRSATSATERHLVAVLIILDNPGLKPSVRESSLRRTTLGELDNYRDNWWCANMNGGPNWGQSYEGYNQDFNLKFVDRDPDFPFPLWLTAPERSEARSQWQKLSAIGTAPNYLTGEVLAYAVHHPEDPLVPQALHLAVRSTRFGCTNIETTKLSKAAFDFLHAHYPQSEWSAKTKYYY
jgi:hypothetical protein